MKSANFDTTTYFIPEEDLLMMSRLNWMTYLKVLFDKLLLQAYDIKNNQDLTTVNANEMLSGFIKIKAHLPLLARNQYM